LNVLAFLPTGILKEFHQDDIVAQATQENADHDYFYHLFMIYATISLSGLQYY